MRIGYIVVVFSAELDGFEEGLGYPQDSGYRILHRAS
jgi:hypothetical protein